jgi:hypothetical protein
MNLRVESEVPAEGQYVARPGPALPAGFTAGNGHCRSRQIVALGGMLRWRYGLLDRVDNQRWLAAPWRAVIDAARAASNGHLLPLFATPRKALKDWGISEQAVDGLWGDASLDRLAT